MKRLLLCSLLVAATVALAGGARAATVPCDQLHVVSSTAGFNDCAGRSVTVDSFSVNDIHLSHSGTWTDSDPFTDLHLLFDPEFVAVSSVGGSFTNTTQGVSWAQQTMVDATAGTGMVWFTANGFDERVRPGDSYTWSAFASFSFNSIDAVNVTIEYTTDVPEPALGVVLLGGLVSLTLLRRRAA